MALDLDDLLLALADPTRRGVVDLLSDRPHRAGELAESLDVAPPALSKHLRVLRQRGIVEELRVDEDARVRVFQLRREPFAELRAWLGEVEAFWTDQLGSFKEHAEARARKKRGKRR